MKNFRWDKKYLHWGITAFCVVACAIIFYMLLRYVGTLKTGLDSLMNILSPFIWGLVIAYLLAPLLDFYQRKLFTPLMHRWGVKKTDGEGEPKGARALSVTLAEITLIAVIGALIYLILPQVYNSIEALVVNSPTYIDKGVTWAENQLNSYPDVEAFVVKTVGNVGDALSTWIQNKVLPSLDGILQNVTNSLIYILKGIYNAVIGIIVSVYILHNKEAFRGRCVKLLYSIFSLESAARIRQALDFTDKVFMGFINGKLLDSAIIGVMCYIFCVIAGMPYSLLVSVIVGRDQHHPVLRAVHRRRALRAADTHHESGKVPYLRYLHHPAAAVRSATSWARRSWATPPASAASGSCSPSSWARGSSASGAWCWAFPCGSCSTPE
jgi:predicted PurR-regulated permease PerM